jgi:signal recognition particle GTPase
MLHSQVVPRFPKKWRAQHGCQVDHNHTLGAARVQTVSKPATYVIELNLTNVKSFAGRHTLNLRDAEGGAARWTLILGANGVGKTTLAVVAKCLWREAESRL